MTKDSSGQFVQTFDFAGKNVTLEACAAKFEEKKNNTKLKSLKDSFQFNSINFYSERHSVIGFTLAHYNTIIMHIFYYYNIFLAYNQTIQKIQKLHDFTSTTVKNCKNRLHINTKVFSLYTGSANILPQRFFAVLSFFCTLFYNKKK
jgi:hypothetical protein